VTAEPLEHPRLLELDLALLETLAVVVVVVAEPETVVVLQATQELRTEGRRLVVVETELPTRLRPLAAGQVEQVLLVVSQDLESRVAPEPLEQAPRLWVSLSLAVPQAWQVLVTLETPVTGGPVVLGVVVAVSLTLGGTTVPVVLVTLLAPVVLTAPVPREQVVEPGV
jgi:hypothetical protein